jgi:phosphomannomutase
LETGRNVVDVGELPLGAGMFYAWKKGLDFAFITGSHLGKEWNGVKFFHGNGIGFLEEENLKVRDIYMDGSKVANENGKTVKPEWDAVKGYRDFLVSKIRAEKRLKVVLDCGNGMACRAAPDIFRGVGFEVEVLFGDVDGNFPNRSPDPMEDPLERLKERARGADLGIAYDGDGDRMVLVDNTGTKLTPEQVSFFILTEVLKEEKGPIIANVECTRVIDTIAKRFDRSVRRIKVGHTFLMETVKESGGCFGVEVSGHYVVPSIVPFDDSLAVSLYAAAILSGRAGPLSEEIKDIPVFPFERVNFECEDGKKFKVVEKLKEEFGSGYGKANFLDGVRIDMDNGWVLIRPSNTSPTIRLTVEGESEKDKEKLKSMFSKIVEREIRKVCE